jgi:hypothetical protein
MPALGHVALEDLTPERVERWAANEIDPSHRLSNRTRRKVITVFHGVMERARKLHRLPLNPVADVEKPRTAARPAIQVFSPEGVTALTRPRPASRTRRSSSRPHGPAYAGAS